jgi:hypothetical protein
MEIMDQDSWIVLQHLNDIVSYETVTLKGFKIKTAANGRFVVLRGKQRYAAKDIKEFELPSPLVFDIRYIVYASVNDTQLRTMIYDGALKMYVFLQKIRADAGINVWVSTSADKLLEIVPKEILALSEFKPLNGNPFEFALSTTPEEELSVWKNETKYTKLDLDLTGYYALNPKVIITAGATYPSVTKISMNQNVHMCGSFSWMHYFPNLTTLTVQYCHITDESLDLIYRYAPNLTSIEFHHCLNVTGRCLLTLAKCLKIEQIVIDGECKMNHNNFETVIKDEEWKELNSLTLTSLYINSSNLTLDFINFCLKSFPALTNYRMHDEVLAKLAKNARSGHSDDKIYFQSFADPDGSDGFYRYSDVKITDLVRNKYGPAFSESMLRKIKELDPTKKDSVEQLEM